MDPVELLIEEHSNKLPKAKIPPTELLDDIKRVVEYNDKFPRNDERRISAEKFMKAVRQKGFGINITKLNNCCRDYLGRSSYARK